MAAKKRSTSVKKTSQTRKVKKEMVATRTSRASRFSESYTSLIVGAVVVILLVILLIAFVRGRNDKNKEQDTSSTNTQSEEQKTYIVQSGDDLWNIAESEYENGYEWVTIAEENDLIDPDNLPVGTELVLPTINPSQSVTNTTVSSGSAQTRYEIDDSTYTVQEGEFLWDIAIRAYGDGYRWVDIAQENNLVNPDLIYHGQTLSLPRS